MRQPHIPQKRIIPLRIQKQLPPMPQSLVRLSIPIRIGRTAPAARFAVQVERVAFADVEEEPEGVVAAVWGVSERITVGGKGETGG